MFGLYRFLLSIFVVLDHLGKYEQQTTGYYSVFGFFVLSGFLMTRIVNETYGNGLPGFGKYLANRAMRILPLYYAALGVTIAIVKYVPRHIKDLVKGSLRMPRGSSEWLHQLFLVGLVHHQLKMIPQAWSLGVEVVYYIAIGLVLGRARWIAILWFLASAAYVGVLVYQEAPFRERYFDFLPSSLCFSLGSVLWHLRAPLQRFVTARHAPFAAGLFAVHTLFSPWYLDDPEHRVGLYIALVLAAYSTIALDGVKLKPSKSRLARVDRFLGNLAYPVFLFHWSVVFLVVDIVGERPSPVVLFVSCLPPLIAVSVLAHQVIEVPIERLRNWIRPRAPPAVGGT